MTARTLQSAAPGLELTGGMYLQLEAIDPTTGLAVTGVKVANVAVFGNPIGGGLDSLESDSPAWVWGDANPLDAA